jgi:hypothetical protein
LVDVFVSYKQEEREAVQIIASSLADLKLMSGSTPSFAPVDRSTRRSLPLSRRQSPCSCAGTHAAIHSEWVRAEATEGRDRNRLVACFLQPTERLTERDIGLGGRTSAPQ